MVGISKTLEVFEDLGVLAVAGISLAKSGVSLSSLGKLLDVARAAAELVQDVKGALPELADLDADESAKIGQAAYGLVKKIVDAAK